nr:tetratricopeptide repeat family domain protein [uncultured bacterium]
MSTHEGRWGSVDVVILAALSLEYEAARQVDAGAIEGSQWEEERRPNDLRVAFRAFHGKKGSRPPRVAVGLTTAVGTVGTITALFPLVEEYRPRCVAMCGVYPGRPEGMNLGDVIVPDRLFFRDMGKRYPNIVQQDLMTHHLRHDWKEALEHFDFLGHLKDQDWWKNRPVSFPEQKDWLLMRLHEGVSAPWTLPECARYCPDWETVFERVVSRGLALPSGELTFRGRKFAESLLRDARRTPGRFSTEGQLPFRVHLKPMDSRSSFVDDMADWGEVTGSMRKALGLEPAALDALAMKGIMGSGLSGDDPFRRYMARTSAECLLAFLREHLEVEVAPGL